MGIGMLALTGIVLVSYAKGFSAEDLAGTWRYHGICAGDAPAQVPGWYYGAHTVNSTGMVTASTTITDSLANSNYTPSVGQISITADGMVTMGGGLLRGVMNASKDLMVTLGTMAPGSSTGVKGYNLTVYSKQAATSFSAADLAGTWRYHGICTGDAPAQVPGWYYGAHTVNSTGMVTASTKITDSLGNNSYTPNVGQISIAADGVVTMGGGLILGVMNARKDLMVAVCTMAPGNSTGVKGYNLMVLSKQPASGYSVADLTGTWRYHGLVAGDAPAQIPGWYSGAHTVNSTGMVIASTEVADSLSNSSYTPGAGQTSITTDGVVTMGGGLLRGVMNASRDLMITVATMAPGNSSDVTGYNLIVSMKNAPLTSKLELSGSDANIVVQSSEAGRNYQLQGTDNLVSGPWTNIGVVRSGDGGNLAIATAYSAAVPRRFYRVVIVEASPAPDGFVLIPAGSFQMGNAMVADTDITDAPIRTVTVGDFHMAKNLVSKASWDSVRTWGLTHGYTDLSAGAGKAPNHPVQTITWYDMVKWCNARSEKDGLTPCYTLSGAVYRTTSNSAVVCNWAANGYRLPTEAEWEKAARGGLIGKRFPWGDRISQSLANYYSVPTGYTYDDGSAGYNSIGSIGGTSPATSPVGSFAANGYGLNDMAGNVWEWCWDWHGTYAAGSQTDPRGVSSGSRRVLRGGNWYNYAHYCRVAIRYYGYPTSSGISIGFRVARSSVP